MKRLLALAIAIGFLAGCTKVGTKGESGRLNAWTQPHVLRYADAEDVAGLNPHLIQQTALGFMASMTMAWLLKAGPDNRPVPELATEVPSKANGGISADGKMITWHLRKDAKWSDGVPFDADDVVFSTNVVNNPKNNEVSRDGWDLITKIDEPDKYTVIYHLKKPYASFWPTFFGSAGANPCILPKHILGKLPTINNAPYNNLPVGIGPFKYESWKRADSVTMVADPLYFRGRPKLDKVIYKIIPDRNTLITAMQTGEVDLWPLAAPAYIERLKALKGFTTFKQIGFYFNHLDFNLTHPAVKELAVREALRYAIDRQTLRDKVGHGVGILQESPISPANPAHDAAIKRIPFNIVKANKLLDDAGWVRGADGIRAKNGTRLSLDFASSTGSPDTDTQIELIRGWWKQIGVKLNRKNYPVQLLFAPLSQGGIVYSGKFDVIVFAWGGDPIGDLSNLYECSQIPPNGQNDPRYCNPRVDQALEKFKGLYDEKERQPYSNFVQEQLVKDVPTIVMSVREDLFTQNIDLKNYHPNALTEFDDMQNVDI